MPFLLGILGSAGNILAPIVAQMGLKLLSERVVRRVAVLTLRHFADQPGNSLTHQYLGVVADALEVPAEVYKKA